MKSILGMMSLITLIGTFFLGFFSGWQGRWIAATAFMVTVTILTTFMEVMLFATSSDLWIGFGLFAATILTFAGGAGLGTFAAYIAKNFWARRLSLPPRPHFICGRI